MRDALLVIRRQGRAALEPMTFVMSPQGREPDRWRGGSSRAVLGALSRNPQTVYELAATLGDGWTHQRVHGVVCWLRKQHKVAVKYWTTSKKGRRVAVYQVKA